MSLLGKTWEMHDPAPREFLNSKSGYSDIISQLLWNRGIKNTQKAKKFLNPDYKKDLHSPASLLDMDKAVSRINKAIEQNERIVIYGDYDADGVCASALFREVFLKLGARNVEVYIPHREDEGYGMNRGALKLLAKKNTDIIITVDCGSTNFEEIKFARDLGMDTVVTDHHQVKDKENPAYAHINPHQKKDKYPFKDLCGTGVAFKVSQALIEYRRKHNKNAPAEGWEKWLLDLVAIATVADVMPLVDENRTLVKYGLYVLAQGKRPGIRALMETSNIKATWAADDIVTNLDAFTLGFVIGPRLNSAGRMEHADLAFNLLSAANSETAVRLAEKLDRANYERRKLVEKIIKEINEKGTQNSHAILWGEEHWPVGVAGIVAGRLSETHNKPAFIYQKKNGKIMGSARAPAHLNVVEVLGSAEHILDRFGGHRQAGGYSASLKHEKDISSTINKYVANMTKDMPPENLLPKITIDAEVSDKDVNMSFYQDIVKLSPHGEGNPKPIFLMKDITVQDPRFVGKDKNHFKCDIVKNERRYSSIGFNFGESARALRSGDKADILFRIDLNQWQGRRSLDLKLVDISHD